MQQRQQQQQQQQQQKQQQQQQQQQQQRKHNEARLLAKVVGVGEVARAHRRGRSGVVCARGRQHLVALLSRARAETEHENRTLSCEGWRGVEAGEALRRVGKAG